MAVYVDQLRKHGWVRRGHHGPQSVRSCHMLTEPGNEEELHAMAARIGLKRSWLHDGEVPHYDLVETKRKAAIRAGAVELNDQEIVKLIDKHKPVGGMH